MGPNIRLSQQRLIYYESTGTFKELKEIFQRIKGKCVINEWEHDHRDIESTTKKQIDILELKNTITEIY